MYKTVLVYPHAFFAALFFGNPKTVQIASGDPLVDDLHKTDRPRSRCALKAMRTVRNLRILPILKLLRKIQVANCAQHVDGPREA